MVSGFGFRVSGFGFRVSGFGFKVEGLGFRVQVDSDHPLLPYGGVLSSYTKVYSVIYDSGSVPE